MEKIILFYKFVPIADPDMAVRWQTELCKRLGLRGRIIVAAHGINGTLGGETEDVLAYKRAMNASGIFRGIDYKWTAGSRNDFPRLSVKARPELVAFGVADELEVDESGVVGGGVHLSPRQVNELVAERGDEVVFFDGRNAYEALIGKFRNAVVPPVRTTHDFLQALDDQQLRELKDRPIVTYCTGGIRCEILSALMIQRGFDEVYQLDGGIVNYVAQFGEDGLWEGSVYTFDKRMVVDFETELSSLGRCDTCGAETRVFRNCSDLECPERFLRCDGCCERTHDCAAHQRAAQLAP